jgi:hypothetical protein
MRYVSLSRRSKPNACAVSSARSNVFAATPVRHRLVPVGVRADDLRLAVPQPREVDRHLRRHPHQHDRPRGRVKRRQAAIERESPTASIVASAPTRVVADDVAADEAAHRAGQLVRLDDGVRSELAGERALVRVAAPTTMCTFGT